MQIVQLHYLAVTIEHIDSTTVAATPEKCCDSALDVEIRRGELRSTSLLVNVNHGCICIYEYHIKDALIPVVLVSGRRTVASIQCIHAVQHWFTYQLLRSISFLFVEPWNFNRVGQN